MSEYFEIAYAAASNRLCLFTGTGFSKALTNGDAPGWQQLLEQVCDAHLDLPGIKDALFPADGKSSVQLDEAAQIISLELTRAGKNIHEIIADKIKELKLADSCPETRKFLKERQLRVVTTNYDKLVELASEGEYLSLCPGRPVPRSESRVKVYHVHGSVDVPSRMVVTADDYFNFMHSESYFSRKLSTILHENTVVIIGYSLGDLNLKTIMNDYRGFVRNHAVSNSVFFVSRNKIDQRIADYYSNCYGIRVIDETEVEDFFDTVNSKLIEAEKVSNSIKNIKKVLYEGATFKTKYLQSESSFYEIVSAISAVGASVSEECVVSTLADVVEKKKQLTSANGAWEQYVQLASWLTYFGGLLDLRGTAAESVFLDSVKFSMNKMSKKQVWGYSWHAYKVWDARWRGLTADNRRLISAYIKEQSSDPDALEISSRG